MSLFNVELPPGFQSALTDMEKQFVSLRSSGSSIRNIAKTLKKSPTTICNWNKKFSMSILSERNKSFCDLQKKVIDLKNSRIDFLNSEIERITKVLKKCKIKDDGVFSDYDPLFGRFVKISDILSAYENDILKVGISFKDNISPESDLTSVDSNNHNTVIPGSNDVITDSDEIITDKSYVKSEEKQNCNTETFPKKFFHKKQ
ncbi:MAG: hypothetical protein WC358_04750 [Ignavibacteria bacterium]|jgi:hypothetical protein